MERDAIVRKMSISPKKRAFQGLVGRFDGEPAQPAATPAEKRKRGRPPKNTSGAMSGAERTRTTRNKQAVKKTLAEHPDSKGRIHNEESGGYGKNEIAKAADGIDLEREGDKDVGGKGIRPTGYGENELRPGSEKSEKESEFANHQNWSLNWGLNLFDKGEPTEELLELADALARENFVGQEAEYEYWCGPIIRPSTLTCKLCGKVVDTRKDAMQHILPYFKTGPSPTRRWLKNIPHRKEVLAYMKLVQPARVASKPRGCPVSWHKDMVDRYLKAGHSGPFQCGDCKRKIDPAKFR